LETVELKIAKSPVTQSSMKGLNLKMLMLTSGLFLGTGLYNMPTPLLKSIALKVRMIISDRNWYVNITSNSHLKAVAH